MMVRYNFCPLSKDGMMLLPGSIGLIIDIKTEQGGNYTWLLMAAVMISSSLEQDMPG
ncbi:hypothetical protein PAECIP112173_02660 [Paenibacillus sp. JJ-100]|nr:hypothetical protein PAECIP112173_02660 [Paenibacillus sp. JJ-100]